VIVTALSASACAPPTPAKPPKPSPSSTALFASDEEALAAAEEAYREYLSVIDDVLQGGGAETAGLGAVAANAALDQALADAREFASLGYRTVGTTGLNAIVLQRMEAGTEDSIAIVEAYVCEDASQVDLVNAEGISLVSDDRPPLTPFQVSFSNEGERGLVLTSRSAWDGEGVCL
jgi:hypothetical protein